jgi:hypothetical protein
LIKVRDLPESAGRENVRAARVSSPASTGGAGTFFEQHVATYWLAQLLVHAIPPILTDTVVTEVSLQTERLGYHTDDFLVVCEGAAAPKKLAGQVKRNFTVSAANDDCVQAIGDFWKDFTGARFSSDNDRLVLVTLRGTNTLLEHFVGLLDCARASRDGAEFDQRLATDGFISGKAVQYCREVQKIIGDLEGKIVTAANIWPFLHVLHMLSLDLHSSTRQTEAHIKALLAYTVTSGDAVAGAAVSWNELIIVASTAIAEARTLRRADLAAALQERHAPISTNEQRVLQALHDHTGMTLQGIRSTIGRDFHLQRAGLVQKVVNALEEAQVVLLTGPAGTGKSVIGKDTATLLKKDQFVFGFRVEEFAEPHLDRTLAASNIPANTATFSAILAAQSRKVVLVESVERLLEKTTRDAFSDLMTLATDDGGMRIILTCRDYSVEQVRTSFLQPAHINPVIIRVPPLDDAELAQAEAANPALAIPLKNPTLRNILRNPFFLDKALEISWLEDKHPKNEREFRALFWREIVRADHRVPAGTGRSREEVLQEIAVRRARALSAYVLCTGLDPAVIELLRRDSLVDSPERNLSLVATAHDVLEDWAILQWLEEQHFTNEGSFKALSTAIGAHPAVRRSYRRWVVELIERDAAAADRLFQAAISETDITLQFRDDTLVSLLKAPSVPNFLMRHEGQLLANDRTILKRVVHLLRVACVKTHEWLEDLPEQGSIPNVPDGSAWSTVLMLVHRNLASFTPQDRGLLLGLIEDAVRGVSWWAPELEGAEFVAGIAHWLLEKVRGYDKEPRKRVLKVIARIPKADPARFETVLRGHMRAGERRDPVANDLHELIYAGTDGAPAARDLPDLIVSVGAEYLLASDADIEEEYRYPSGELGLELYFGIKERRQHDSFPASAMRGPWIHLLRCHRRKALDFYIRVFNHSADWYAHPRLPDRLEPPWDVELTFADGTKHKQWANGRLWGLYRGMSVGPYALQSMLMALENWLLAVAEQSPAQLDAILVNILRRSDSAALAAVVASIATAHPHSSGEALLDLLSARDYVVMDRARMASEPLSGMFPTFGTDHRVYGAERKQANDLAHHRYDLEAAITKLQLGSFAPRVHALLDMHRAALPPNEQQDQSDRLWRLAIHRMDLRQYEVSDLPRQEISGAEEKPDELPHRYVSLEPKPPDADVLAMLDESAARFAPMNARLGVFMWGLQAFKREDGRYDPAQWAAMLAKAQAMDRETDHQDGSRHGPGFVATVCVRDHWDEMSGDQQDWCIDVVCSEVMRHADQGNDVQRMQRSSMAADRACAYTLPLLLRKARSESQIIHVRQAFAAAITHPIDEVRLHAASGIDEDFWAVDRAVAVRCVNAIATEATLIDKAWEEEVGRQRGEQRQRRNIMGEAATRVRERFWQDGAIAEDAHVRLDTSKRFGANALTRLLIILGRVPQDPLAITAFVRASNTLVGWWKSRNDRDHGRGESVLAQHLEEFLLRTTPEAARDVLAPMLDTIDRHSGDLRAIMQGLTGIQDSNPNTPQYWFLWCLFAESVKRANWVPSLGDERPKGSELLSAIFLTAFWNDNVRHWRFLDGYAHLVPTLFEALPPTSIVLDNYVRFLYHIGERSLPEAFVRVADALRQGDAQRMLEKANTVFLLEVLLQRHVYGRPLELKSHRTMREALVFILDSLVEAGSSAAFRMRDDFVTPAA